MRCFGRDSEQLGSSRRMAVYTALDHDALASLIDDYGLLRVTASHGIPTGSVNSNFVLETPRGKHLLRIDEVKGELDVKRELDLLLFLRKSGYYREIGGKCVSLYRYVEGKIVPVERIGVERLEHVGRLLAELHTIAK